jgi:hypothetical protein
MCFAGDRPSAQVTLWLGYSPESGAQKQHGIRLYHNNSYVATLPVAPDASSPTAAEEGSGTKAAAEERDGALVENKQRQEDEGGLKELELVGVALLEQQDRLDPESGYARWVVLLADCQVLTSGCCQPYGPICGFLQWRLLLLSQRCIAFICQAAVLVEAVLSGMQHKHCSSILSLGSKSRSSGCAAIKLGSNDR